MNFDFDATAAEAHATQVRARCNPADQRAMDSGARALEQRAPQAAGGAAAVRGADRRSAGARRASQASTGPRVARAWLLLPVSVLCTAAIVFGWRTRDEYYVVPDEGLGYALGIAGLVMLLLLLLYTVRKRVAALSGAGPLRHWFHVHMALGLLGPTAILYHSNFSLGSLNANVALFCMLTVSASGIVGRFIYTRIHYEYRGRVASFAELRERASEEGGVLAEAEAQAPQLAELLDAHRTWAFRPRSLPGRLVMIVQLGMRGRATRRRALRVWRKAEAGSGGAGPRPATRAIRRALTEQLRAVRRVAEYSTYERFFALWHALHLPFCVGLYVAAAVHVVAVHMY